MSEFTKQQAQDWLAAMDSAHIEIMALFECAVWALESHKSIRDRAFGEDNVFSFKDRAGLSKDIKPWPDNKNRNFQQIGKDLDCAFSLLNKLLPEFKI